MEYDVTAKPTYISMGYPVREERKTPYESWNIKLANELILTFRIMCTLYTVY